MIDAHQRQSLDHLITIEDPIEFLHRDKRSFINQRASRSRHRELSTALRAALRQVPTSSWSRNARPGDHFHACSQPKRAPVFSTLHTLDATENHQRTSPSSRRPSKNRFVWQLAAHAEGSRLQRLVRRADDNGRVPACEVMITTAYLRDCIINPDKTRLIHDAISAAPASTACRPSISRS